MDKERFETFLDYGSSKLRVGVYDNEYSDNNFSIDEVCNNSFSIKKFSLCDSDNKINQLIKILEKKTDTHLNKISLMIDSPDFEVINIVSKKKFEGRSVGLSDIKYLLQDLNLLVKKNNSNLKIIHLIATKIIIDGKEFFSFPDDSINCDELLLEVVFVCLPNTIIKNIKESLKKKFISIEKIYCSSYLKSFYFKESFTNYEKKFFLDIGYEKSSLLIYKKNKLIFIKFLSLGGNNITKDISKVLNISEKESEDLKINFSKNILPNNSHNKFLKEIIFARLDEIINLIFEKIDLKDFYDKQEKSILIFTGEGSKILDKNSVFLNENFEYFDDVNVMEETTPLICDATRQFNIMGNPNEIDIIAKKQRKFGFFERIFSLLK
tara:strand:- start:1862 stop:3001 length:1140 start_codon:yes stop_codon:yes gene_type:complete